MKFKKKFGHKQFQRGQILNNEKNPKFQTDDDYDLLKM